MKSWYGVIHSDKSTSVHEWQPGVVLPRVGAMLLFVTGPFVSKTESSAKYFIDDWADYYFFNHPKYNPK